MIGRLTRWAAILAAMTATAACYSTRPYGYLGHDSNATVVIYRKADVNLGAVAAFVAIDDQGVAELHNDQYVEIHLAPGVHQLKLNGTGYPRPDVLAVEVADLERRFFEVKPNPANLAAATASAVDPTPLGTMATLLFTRPFLFEWREERDFRTLADRLERTELPIR